MQCMHCCMSVISSENHVCKSVKLNSYLWLYKHINRVYIYQKKVTVSFSSCLQSYKREWQRKQRVSCLTRKSWCWPPGRGFRTVWSACRLAGEPRHRSSLRDGLLAKPGASASPPNPVGIQPMKNQWNIFHAGECTEHRVITEKAESLYCLQQVAAES